MRSLHGYYDDLEELEESGHVELATALRKCNGRHWNRQGTVKRRLVGPRDEWDNEKHKARGFEKAWSRAQRPL